MQDRKVYLSPFLTSHALHLIIGNSLSGKTTYALQMMTQHLRTEPAEAHPWVQFSRGEMPEEVWYVDLTAPREDVLDQVRRLGLGEPGTEIRRLKVLSDREILEIRPESARREPITFQDILTRIGVTTGGKLPQILIVDGFSLLFASNGSRDNQAGYERAQLREIENSYLIHGGCLVGIHMSTKLHRIPGTEHVMKAYLSSLTELSTVKSDSHKRKAVITGKNFSPRSMMIEFDDVGRFQLAIDATEDPAKRSIQVDDEIQDSAIELSFRVPEVEFKRGDLVKALESKEIARTRVDRWIKRNRSTGAIREGRYGWYTLNPKPQKTLPN